MGVHSRCKNPKSHAYKYYGGRGIKTEWGDFVSFKNDMYESYKDAMLINDSMSLDRINNDGDYSKSNCRWATKKEQIANSRCVKLITIKGDTKNQTEWASFIGISVRSLKDRIKNGWSEERILAKRKPSG